MTGGRELFSSPRRPTLPAPQLATTSEGRELPFTSSQAKCIRPRWSPSRFCSRLRHQLCEFPPHQLSRLQHELGVCSLQGETAGGD